METNDFEEENREYFRLDQSIEESRQRINDMRKEFYGNSMHTRTETGAEGKMYSLGFRQELEVTRLVDCLADIEKHIKKNQKKKRYLDDYLQTLPSSEQDYLFERYVRGLDVPLNKSVEMELNVEVNEIEEAIHFIYGYEPEPKHVTQVKDFKTNFGNMLDALGVK